MESENSIFQKKILIIDDEESIQDVLKTALQKEGFRQVLCAGSGEAAIELCRQENPDLIILDVMLPDIDGFEVCRRLREITLAPILFVSAKSEDTDKILGLGIGGDDYITKPFSPKEVAFRVKAQLRRGEYYLKPQTAQKDANFQDIISFGDIKIDTARGEVLKNGQAVTLTAMEYGILLYLVQHPNHIISKKRLYEAVWKETYMGDDNTIMVHIRHLREKLEDDPANPRYILTVKGLGYKLETRGLQK
ncbi:response regulator transcription factor [Caldanaerobacter subterraneus]|uniref:Stage 0 sporulation protein A homolog n=1 Tax=Caldanaerobacter subterraneus TaxID=911092 RepID=A0A4R2JKA6_9THEO|nr:response regulator transcription factor [Caldanaerobacter subterraneus]TCO60421.1 DNA-binding response OmpR family regulator [Caldanaerobacter subterraneus]